jgi:lysophospholipase L1-like esterase
MKRFFAAALCALSLAGPAAAVPAGVAPGLSGSAVANVGGQLNLGVSAWGRQQFPRTRSVNAGFNLMTARWHRTPPVAVTALTAFWYAGYQNQSGGLVGVGNDVTFAACVQYPPASACPANQAFSKNGVYQVSVTNGTWAQSDPLYMLLPASTDIRLRSYCAPNSVGGIPTGIPLLGAANGELSGVFGGAQNDTQAYTSGQTDTTQGTNGFGNTTSDGGCEPLVIATPATYVKTWALLGDSLTYGALEVGFGGGTSIYGAGDSLGNVGYWARAIALAGQQYINFGISGSQLHTWATPGYSNFIFAVAKAGTNRCIIALGTNDIPGQSAATIEADLQTMVTQCLANGAQRVVVGTIPPRSTSTDGFATLANQTVDATRSPTIDTVNAWLLAGNLSNAANPAVPITVIDVHGIFADGSQTDKWAVAGNARTLTGCSISSASATLTCSGTNSAADVGTVLNIPGAGAASAALVEIVTAVPSSTTFTVNTAASTTVSGQSVTIGGVTFDGTHPAGAGAIAAAPVIAAKLPS